MNKAINILLVLIAITGSLKAQKGESSLYGGLFVAFPIKKYGYPPAYGRGIGLETAGQYNISNKSALLLQSHLLIYIESLFFKTGYQYSSGSSGIYINGLAGPEIDLSDGFTTISFTFGAGKRFTLNEKYFINAGVDYVDGDSHRILNIKTTLGYLLNRARDR